LPSILSKEDKLVKFLYTPALGYNPSKENQLLILRDLYDLFLAFGIDKSEEGVKLILNDILVKYFSESVNDIILCLKNGRQGNYKEKIYGKNFNMQVFSAWMSEYLEQKYTAKEKILNNAKKEASDNWTSKEDYHEAIKRGKKASDMIEKQKKDDKKSETNYNNFKAKYFAKKK